MVVRKSYLCSRREHSQFRWSDRDHCVRDHVKVGALLPVAEGSRDRSFGREDDRFERDPEGREGRKKGVRPKKRRR